MSTAEPKITSHSRSASDIMHGDPAVLMLQHENDIQLYHIGLDENVSWLETLLPEFCADLRSERMTEVFNLLSRSRVMLFTASILGLRDSRNIHLTLDQQDSFRLPAWKDLLSADDLKNAAQRGEPPTILVKIEISKPFNVELAGLIGSNQPHFRVWRDWKFADMRSVIPTEEVPIADDTRILSLNLPAKGQAKVSLQTYDTDNEQKRIIMKHNPYTHLFLPSLTFQPYKPMQGIASGCLEPSLLLSVRLINHLQTKGLGRVQLPAQACIEIVPPNVPARRIKSALTYALDQMKTELDVGKGKSDQSCVSRLFEHGGGKKWTISLWVMPQGREKSYFHHYEGSSLVDFCLPGWRAMHVEAHFVPSDIHHTKQSALPRESTPSITSDDGQVQDHVHLYGFVPGSTEIQTTHHRQQLLSSKLDWSSRHFEHFFHVDLVDSADLPAIDNDSSNLSTASSILQAILNKRRLVTDYDNRQPQLPLASDQTNDQTQASSTIRHVGINVINSLHALRLDGVRIPSILLRTAHPRLMTTSSVVHQILHTLESQAVHEDEIALGCLFTTDTKYKWRLQLWCLPQKDSTITTLPANTTWDHMFTEDNDSLYVEAHLIPIIADDSEQALATPEKKIDKGKGRAEVVDLSDTPQENDDEESDDDSNGLWMPRSKHEKDPLAQAINVVRLTEGNHQITDEEILAEQRNRAYVVEQEQLLQAGASSEVAQAGPAPREYSETLEGHDEWEQDRADQKTIDEAQDREIDDEMG